MTDDTRTIASAFDERAQNYPKNEWHREYAERFIELADIGPGQRVLDAGTGTGFAAIEIARRVGPGGRVVGVDVSQGMLDQARAALDAAGFPEVELLQADATDLPRFPAGSFDAVLCSSALLYMTARAALAEWHRLLAANGLVGFSTMLEGSPSAGRVFRECAAEFGVRLTDPSAELGSEERSRRALQAAGFDSVRIVRGEIDFSSIDLALAWESNARSANHYPVRSLSQSDQDKLRARFESEMRRGSSEDPAGFSTAHVLYVFGRK